MSEQNPPLEKGYGKLTSLHFANADEEKVVDGVKIYQRKDAIGRPVLEMGNLTHNDREKDVVHEDELDEQGNIIKPNPTKKLPENVYGKFYCDSKCISCDLCGEVAPNSFTRIQDAVAQSFVYKQPTSLQEETLCREAIKCCPVHAIGEDGLSVAADFIPIAA